MQLTLSFDEVLALATREQPLPPIVESVRCEASTVFAEIDLSQIESTSFMLKIAAVAAGTVSVAAQFAGFADGVATFAVTAHARGFAAHKLLPLLIDRVNSGINESKHVAGLIEVRDGTDHPRVLVNVQRALDARVSGFTVTAVDLAHATVTVRVRVNG